MSKVKLLLFVFSFIFLLFPYSIAQASFLDNIKDFVTGTTPAPTITQGITIDSKIFLAPGGDFIKNGQIDSGDTITFSYTIINRTNQEYSFGTLKTNIPRNNLHFIHNIYGTVNLSDKNKTITIPNLRISPQQKLDIKFDAVINYSPDNDLSIFTQPEYVDGNNKSIAKSKNLTVIAKKIDKSKIPTLINTKKIQN